MYRHYLFSLLLMANTIKIQTSPTQLQKSAPTITIWVHGTKRLPGVAPLPLVKKFFHCEQGLHKAETLPEDFHHRRICTTLLHADPQRFQAEHLYLFGWSGKLEVNARIEAAHKLAEDIKKLINIYKSMYQLPPRIRVITHSHGGNVVLHMAENSTTDFYIDELILLACPVQKKTAHLITSPLFKTIYSFYSVIDLLQVADPQGLYHNETECPIFSQRKFAPQPNLKQQDVKIFHRPIMHVEFMLPHFLRKLPTMLDEIENFIEK